ncbi:hypothetical protein WPS_06570 [Vulcanimicrobium alpinum]|uniref:Uncharacterized protein n=1 Tax=Vulcanimicrobium alpinum TaxID=3016050 RepID=A0AAN2C8W2_UNVUL|nr:hypothetical protein [Vulcanimicrobium alpinum]BDE05381.1 hypothetical protein WPS_06570 [Vulcanimicrobium alpinum]
MRNRRLGPSGLLIAGALVLVVSILIGQKLGDRVLLQTERRIPVAGAGITPVPEASPEDRTFFRNWKRLQVVAVATDPAFPDPRVTPPPTPTPAPVRIRHPVRLTPRPFPTITSIYTSPPLPIPLVSHDPNETEPPIPEASP